MKLNRSLPWAFLFAGFLIAIEIIFSSSAFAQAGVISANCSGINCQLCNLFSLADSLIKYLIYIAVPITAVVLAYAGFLFMAAGASSENISKAKTLFKDAVFGFLIALLGFMIVDTIIQSLASGTLKSAGWRGVSCIYNRDVGGAFGAAPQTPAISVTPTPNQSGSGRTIDPTQQYTEDQARQILADAGVTINNQDVCAAGQTSGCTTLAGINQGTIAQVVNLKQACGCDVQITGGTEEGHSTAGGTTHQDGYKIDIAPTPQLDTFIKQLGEPTVRSDGASVYSDRYGNTYAREGNHWDITVQAVGNLR